MWWGWWIFGVVVELWWSILYWGILYAFSYNIPKNNSVPSIDFSTTSQQPLTSSQQSSPQPIPNFLHYFPHIFRINHHIFIIFPQFQYKIHTFFDSFPQFFHRFFHSLYNIPIFRFAFHRKKHKKKESGISSALYNLMSYSLSIFHQLIENLRLATCFVKSL